MPVKKVAKKFLKLLGYELRRLPKHHIYGADAYADQKVLLSGQGVRTIFDVGANVGQTAPVGGDRHDGNPRILL